MIEKKVFYVVEAAGQSWLVLLRLPGVWRKDRDASVRQLNIKECHEILLYNILYIFYRTRGDYNYSVRCGNYQQYSNYFSIGPLRGFCAIVFRMVYLNFAGFCFFFVLLSYSGWFHPELHVQVPLRFMDVWKRICWWKGINLYEVLWLNDEDSFSLHC